MTLFIDTSSRIEELRIKGKQFPMWALLTIYTKAGQVGYINYMEGFKALISWLGPIQTGIPEKFIPEYSDLLISYEIQEMAKHLSCDPMQIIHCILTEMPVYIHTDTHTDTTIHTK